MVLWLFEHCKSDLVVVVYEKDWGFFLQQKYFEIEFNRGNIKSQKCEQLRNVNLNCFYKKKIFRKISVKSIVGKNSELN